MLGLERRFYLRIMLRFGHTASHSRKGGPRGGNTWCPGGARRRPRWRVAKQDNNDGRGGEWRVAAEGGRRARTGRENAEPQVVLDLA